MESITFQQRLIPPSQLRWKRFIWTIGFIGAGASAFGFASLTRVVSPPDEPATAAGFAVGVLLLCTIFAVIGLGINAYIWWSERTDKPARRATITFDANGWRYLRGDAEAEQMDWWPHTRVSIHRKGSADRIRLSIEGTGSYGTNGRQYWVEFVPPKGLTLSAVRSQIGIWIAQSGDAHPPSLTAIKHCPACGYRLDVPRRLSRPGRCPECGWTFTTDTIVLRGFAGRTYSRRIGVKTRSRLVDRGLLALSAIALLGGMVLLAWLLGQVGRTVDGLHPLIRQTCFAFVVVGFVLVMLWALVVALRKGETANEKRDRKVASADRPVGSDGVVLTPEGFRQFRRRPSWPQNDERVSRIRWPGWHARPVRYPNGMTRLCVDRPTPSPVGRWLRRMQRRVPLWSWFVRRPVDIAIPLSRTEHRKLRRRLRAFDRKTRSSGD
ncbi:MAG: hypothetical protein AAGD32_10320 [Planctomycetota bacterium]